MYAWRHSLTVYVTVAVVRDPHNHFSNPI